MLIYGPCPQVSRAERPRELDRIVEAYYVCPRLLKSLVVNIDYNSSAKGLVWGSTGREALVNLSC